MLDSFLQGRGYETSECTFTNLYIWRKAYNVQWGVAGGMLCVTMSWSGKTFFLPPYGDNAGLAQALQAMTAYAHSTGIPFLVKGATAHMIRQIETAMPGQFIFERDPDNDDYIHLTQELIELPGRKYNAKKNHIHHFEHTYPDYSFMRLTPDTAMACLDTAYEWYQKKKDDDDFLNYEFHAVKDALEQFEVLGLRGGAILIYGKVVAFSLGEPLNSEMAVIHVEKGNSDIRGAYQLINRECCRYCWPEFTYVNREEDMGIPGLRKAKHSYHPVKMLEKYDVTIR